MASQEAMSAIAVQKPKKKDANFPQIGDEATPHSAYGYFDNDAREFVITDPRTPTKWVNYIGSLEFGGIVDQTGGALLCAGDPGLNRITKYIPQLPASDFRGTTLYLRIRGNHGFEVLTPFFTPGLEMPDEYRCHVGLGYQRIVTVMKGIRVEVTIFVPHGEPVEVRDIQVTNERATSVEVDVIPVVEYSHFDALKQLANADWVPQTMMSEAEATLDGRTLLYQYPFMRKNGEPNFFSASRAVDSFETDRHRFLGSNDYGTWASPESLQEESLSNYEARRGDNIGALLISLGRLETGATEQVSTFLGQSDREKIASLTEKYSQHDAVLQALAEMSEFWENYLSVFQCQTPDADFDAMVNVHNPRQCLMTMNWSRYLSLYQLGIGTRGLGMRDSSQDVLGGMSGAPETAKELMRKLLSIQLEDGSAMHQFYPATMHADHGDAEEENTDKKIYGDDHLWIVASLIGYLKETGDEDFLKEEISFYGESSSSATVLEHLKRSLAYSKSHTGAHGLPLLGFADWNDCVNLAGKSESMFNACLYGYALLEMIELCDHLGLEAEARQYREDHAAMAQTVNQCWDGDWYIRYYREDGSPIGSKSNEKGSLFTNAQSWPVMAGFAPAERAERALDSVRERHQTRFGIMLSSPGYDEYDPAIGGVTTYPPGAKENGGIFLHSNPWVMIAETKLGRGDRAFEYYSQINPAKRLEDIELYEVEPYCYAQNILGKEHPEFGLGRNSWLSGTASWMYHAASKYILGIRPALDGLIIDPCIPSDWGEFKVTRKSRGASYQITVKNPNGVNRRVTKMTVDGEEVTVGTIAWKPTGTTCRIEVVLG